MDLSSLSHELAEVDGKINDVLRALSNGFQKLDKVKDANRRNRQLEDLTDKMRDCKRLIKDFEREVRDLEGAKDPSTSRMLNEKKQSMIKDLNSFVALKKQYQTNRDPSTKRSDAFGSAAEEHDNAFLASNMSNQQLIDGGNKMMDDTDQSIERSKKVVQETVGVGTDTAAALKSQTEQMSRIVNELDSIHFSMKKASKVVKEIARQVATDRCIVSLLFLIVMGVVAMIVVKVMHPKNKDISDIPGLAPPVPARRLLWKSYQGI